MPRSVFTLALGLVFCSNLLAQRTINVPKDQPTIQAGINAAANGDTVLVAPGNYPEHLDFLGKAILVTSSAGASTTIIDGSGGTPAVVFKNGETRNSILNGFTIQNGGAETYDSSFPIGYGDPGIYMASATAPTLTNNILTRNHCWTIMSEGVPLIQNNQINNTLDHNGSCSFAGGAAIWLFGSQAPTTQSTLVPTVIGNLIENNTQSGQEDAGGNGGAGVAAWVGNAVIENNVIRNNSTHGVGGAILLEDSSGLVIQNLIYNNRSGGGGGGLATDGYLGAPAAVIANNTFYNNTFGSGGGSSTDYGVSQLALGYFSGYGPSTILVNNIIAGSSPEPAVACDTYVPSGQGDYFLADHNLFLNTGGPLFTKCADPTGTYGNISANPLFVDPAGGNFHLQKGSPAIDAGNNSVVGFLASKPQQNSYGDVYASVLLDKDLDGNPRVSDSTGRGFPTIDMGAYEYTGTQDANATSLLLTPSYYQSQAGQPFKLSLRALSAAGTPSGAVTFLQDGATLGTLNLDATGSAVFSNSGLTPGIHRFLATYPGESVFQAAVSIETIVVVSKYGVTLSMTSAPRPSLIGQTVTFSIAISAADTNQLGPVTVYEGNTLLATLTPDSTGKASFPLSTLAKGYHYITASYAGDQTHNSASVDVEQTVQDPNDTTSVLTSSTASSIVGQPVVFTATVTSLGGSAPVGTVEFRANGGILLGTQNLSAPSSTGTSTASLTTTALPLGNDTVAAVFVPSAPFNASTSNTLYQQVSSGYATTTNVQSSLNPSPVNQPVTFIAHVTSSNGTPTGSVTFMDGTATLGSQPLDFSGNASISTSALTSGPHTITATYTPTGTFAGSSGQVFQQVNGLATTSALSVTPLTATVGDPIQLTANVTSTSPGTITGTVTFLADGNPFTLPVPLSGGSASFSTASLRPGSHTLSCAYSGDATFAPSNCSPVAVTVNNADTAVTLVTSANPALALNNFTLTANLSSRGKPYQNTVLFYVDSKLAKAVATDANGNAVLTLSLPAGQHAINAQFPGNDGFAGSSASLTETAAPNATATNLSAAPNPIYQNQPLALSATVAPTAGTAQPYGTVAIFEGAAQLASLTIPPSQNNPTASFSISTLAPGTHLLTAVYTPSDANFLGSSTATAFSVTVLPQGFTFTVDTPSVRLETEHHATMTLMLKSFGGFTGTIHLACGQPLPAQVTCELPLTARLTANNTVPVSVTIDTDAVLNFKSEAAPSHLPGRKLETLAWASLVPLALVGMRRRRTARWLAMLILAVATLGSLSGCGSKYPDHTPPGTYDITVTAIGAPDGTISASSQTLHLGLVVTP